MIRLTLLLIIVFFLVILGFTNSNELVRLNYFFGSSRPIPVAWLIAGTFAAGLLFGWLFMLPGWVKMRIELRRQRKAQDRLKEEIGEYRKIPANEINIPTRSEPDEF